MDIARATDGRFEEGGEARFTGDVRLRATLRAEDGTNIGVVHFPPAARTHWHNHPGGHVLEPGDVIHVQAGEWHFHGGTPESPLVHVAINGGGDAVWGDPVTDDEYAEGF